MVTHDDGPNREFPEAAEPVEMYGVAAPEPKTTPRSSLPPVIPQVVWEDEPAAPPPSPRAWMQFTLADLLIVMTGLAVMLSVAVTFRWNWPVAAGLAGVGAFFATVVLVNLEPEQTTARRVCWGMLAVYVFACLTAIVTRG
ncbi:MAG: hypothetical protein JW809_05660 [Pirellulales bacterium]|nr:hypothetical protein [Pirellulales bacterium]